MQNVQIAIVGQLEGMKLGQFTNGDKKIDPEVFKGILKMLSGEINEEAQPILVLQEEITVTEEAEDVLGDIKIEASTDESEAKQEEIPMHPQMLKLLESISIQESIAKAPVDNSPLAKEILPVEIANSNEIVVNPESKEIPVEMSKAIKEMITVEKTENKSSETKPMVDKPSQGKSITGDEIIKGLKEKAIHMDTSVSRPVSMENKVAEADIPKGKIVEVNKEPVEAVESKKVDTNNRNNADEVELLPNVRMDNNKQIHIHKSPIQDVRAVENVEKVELSMVKFIETAREGEATTMVVKLNPEALGEVNLDLKMENGKLTAKIFVQSTQVREMIDSKLAELTGNLQKHNINIEKIQIQVSQGTESQQLDMGQQGSFKGHQNRQNWQRQTNHIFKHVEVDKAKATTGRAEGLNILA